MKNLKIAMLLLFLLGTYACEEVVDVELEESEPRLVVEASILWEKGTTGHFQIIRLTTTAPFFAESTPPAEGAEVSVKSENGTLYVFEELEPGFYINDFFEPEMNMSYDLEIIYKEEVYIATESLIPVSPLEFVEQSTGGGFGGEDIELRAYYFDPPDVENYYFFRFFTEDLSIQISEDEFTDGNLTFAYFSNEDLVPGQEVKFEIQGISKRFYEYMFILRSQAGTNGGGPFQTQPTTVRGNIINTTTPENFAFGYYRLSETDLLEYTIQ
ncbi:MAG: DUF4249 domain-containing protein [Bacteroidota bacterium]